MGNQAGVAFLKPFSIGLARDFKNTPPTRSASVPVSPKALRAFQFLISDLSSGLGRRQMLIIRAANGAEFLNGHSASLLVNGPAKTPSAHAMGAPALAFFVFDSFAPAHLASAWLPAAIYQAAVQPPGCVNLCHLIRSCSPLQGCLRYSVSLFSAVVIISCWFESFVVIITCWFESFVVRQIFLNTKKFPK